MSGCRPGIVRVQNGKTRRRIQACSSLEEVTLLSREAKTSAARDLALFGMNLRVRRCSRHFPRNSSTSCKEAGRSFGIGVETGVEVGAIACRAVVCLDRPPSEVNLRLHSWHSWIMRDVGGPKGSAVCESGAARVRWGRTVVLLAIAVAVAGDGDGTVGVVDCEFWVAVLAHFLRWEAMPAPRE
jgi:hypothetical protein